jgi:hypothetical protein
LARCGLQPFFPAHLADEGESRAGSPANSPTSTLETMTGVLKQVQITQLMIGERKK